jgi:hypothetical protein
VKFIPKNFQASECMTLILDSSKDWKVICRGYYRFFSYGAKYAESIDWMSARFERTLSIEFQSIDEMGWSPSSIVYV